MGKKIKIWCQTCHKKTAHEIREIDGKETCACLRCEKTLSERRKMLDIIGYVDPRERYSLRADRAIEEDRVRIGRPF